jgi:hypothetical protein
MASFALGVVCRLVPAADAHAASLDVDPGWRWSGDFGLGATTPDGQPAYIETDTPDDETRLALRFYFNAAAPAFGIAGPITLLSALSAGDQEVVKVAVQPDGGGGAELVYTVVTDTATASTAAVPVSSGWHFLELDWIAATVAGANDGSLTTRLDDEPTAGLAGLDNDLTSIAALRWGLVATANVHTGTLRLDELAARRTGPIGPVLAGSLDIDGDGAQAPLTDGALVLRALFRFTGVTLTSGAVDASCDWCTAEAIGERMGALFAVLDIDDDDTLTALTDGLLVVRYLFGFRGAPLIAGALGDGAQRDTAPEIEAYIASLR